MVKVLANISVIVPIYNVEKYLNRCIDSILHQSYSDFELILVDDGSPDKCGEICDKYAEKDERIIVIHKEKGGLSDARNKGIDWSFENSNSEWITFIDSDDWVHRDYLKTLLDSTLNFNSKVSVCEFLETDKYIEDDFTCKEEKFVNTEEFYVTKNVNAVIAWGKLYKKELFRDIRFPFGKIHEDEFTTYKVLFKCNNIVFITSPLYYYYQRNDSIMGKIWNPKRLDAFQAFEESAKYFESHNYYSALCNCYLNGIKLANETLKYKTKYITKSNKRYLRKKLRKFLSNYKEITHSEIYELSAYYETAYPIFMKHYWLYRGIRHKFSTIF